MSNQNVTTRVVVIGDPTPVQEQIRAALANQAEFELVDILESSERLIRELASTAPNLILVEQLLEGKPTIDLLDDIAQQFPLCPIISILPENDAAQIQRVILAGARAFLIYPFTQINLLSTLRRVNDLELRRQRTQGGLASKSSQASRLLQTVAVFSPRGGVGTSTLATNLAIALHEDVYPRVLLMEGKFYFSHLGVMLNIRVPNTLADLTSHVNALDETIVNEVCIQHSSGIYVLLGPNNLQISQGIRPDDLFTIFITLKRYFDMIIVDCGSALTENTVTLMDASDHIVLVTAPDLVTLHDTSSFIQLSRSLGYPADKIMITLNRDQMEGGVKSTDIEASLHRPLDHKIPDDGANTLRSINRGIPLIMRYPRSPASRAIRQLAQKVANMRTSDSGMVAEAGLEKSKQEALLASSYFG